MMDRIDYQEPNDAAVPTFQGPDLGGGEKEPPLGRGVGTFLRDERRKKGLDTAALLADLDGIASAINERLAGWIGAGGAIVIDTGGDPTIAARRTWTCQLPDGTARYPCGGTHVTWLGALPATTHVVLLSTDSGFRSETVVG